MLRLLRRHRVKCPHRSPHYHRCACPIYVRGTLGGAAVYMAIDQTSWEAATNLVSDWQRAGSIGQVQEQAKTVADAVADFMDEARDRELAADTLSKYTLLLETRLVDWCTAHGDAGLSGLTTDALTKFRATLPGSPLTRSKTQERLKYFLERCVKRWLLKTNPDDGLTEIIVK